MRDESKQRRFKQSVDFTLNFKGLDMKKPDNNIDVDITLPYASGKATGGRSLVFVKDKDFALKVKEKANRVILESEIAELKKQDIEDIIKNYSAILAEGPVMLVVAKYLGQSLAPKGKMPIPIAPDMGSFERAMSGSAGTIKATTKKGKNMPLIHVNIGKEEMENSQLAENAMAIYNAIVPNLKDKTQNIKSAYVKLTMGPAIKVGEKASSGKPAEKGKEKTRGEAEKTKAKKQAPGLPGKPKPEKPGPDNPTPETNVPEKPEVPKPLEGDSE